MTYIMYDFDTGYVQGEIKHDLSVKAFLKQFFCLTGMTDLASPLLFVYDGDVKKAFWIFVQVMGLFVS
jgi:hypothetical protein